MTSRICSYLAVINLTGFAAFGIDKYKAIHHKWRIWNSCNCLPSYFIPVRCQFVSSVCMYFITKPCILLSGSGFL